MHQVLDTAPHGSGHYVEAELVGWSNKATRIERTLKAGGAMIHLCKDGSSCKDSVADKPMFHITEWKVLCPKQVDEEYIGAEQRKKLMKSLTTDKEKDVALASDDDRLPMRMTRLRRKTMMTLLLKAQSRRKSRNANVLMTTMKIRRTMMKNVLRRNAKTVA